MPALTAIVMPAQVFGKDVAVLRALAVGEELGDQQRDVFREDGRSLRVSSREL